MNRKTARYIRLTCLFVGAAAATAAAQPVDPVAEDSSGYGLFITGVLVFGVLVAAVYFVLRRTGDPQQRNEPDGTISGVRISHQSPPPKRTRPAKTKRESEANFVNDPHLLTVDEIYNQDKRTSLGKLPISCFTGLERSMPVELLPDSDKQALLEAIEQTREDSAADAETRNRAVTILSAFRTRNSIDALSQIAMYDLSSNVRARAATVLAEFDHESVFEPIVVACADPSREVRAAAARALFRLKFDRADAWVRIIETRDISRVRQAAKASIEGGIVERSIERLVSPDDRIAYEAYALAALLIRAEETEALLKAIAEHPNELVRRAVLHVFKTLGTPRSAEELGELLEKNELPQSLAREVEEAREACGELLLAR
jgi:HEAT repeat protein